MATLIDCPQSGRGEWKFRLFGTHVRVQFWFWIAMLIFASNRDLAGALTWIAVGFVSILLHEMGHVLAFRYYRRDAEVVLYGFGGLAIPSFDVEGSLAKVVVSVAGPAAGFCLGGLTAAAVQLAGGRLFLSWYTFLPYVDAALSPKFVTGPGSYSLYNRLSLVASDLLFVNLYWGLVNLLPVWPLDGGHVSRAILEQWDSYSGRRKSLIVSALTAAAVAIGAAIEGDQWVAIMFGIFAVSSFQLMEGQQRRPIPAYRRYRD
jgi:Zn-dependent protease